MNSIQVADMIRLFVVLLVVGTGLLLPMFDFKWRKLVRSSLFVKTAMWIPIFAGFVAVLYMQNWMRLVLVLVIAAFALRELRRQWRAQPEHHSLMRWYYGGFVFCALQIPTAGLLLQSQQFINFLVTVCFASALSDVVAFFSGKYYGKHHLPAALNNNKSWEGVVGQFAGALLGVILLSAFGIASVFFLWFWIALGTVAGDLSNSFVKRRLGIKDWGNSIPGHGGYLDRFASLFGGIVVALFVFFLFG